MRLVCPPLQPAPDQLGPCPRTSCFLLCYQSLGLSQKSRSSTWIQQQPSLKCSLALCPFGRLVAWKRCSREVCSAPTPHPAQMCSPLSAGSTQFPYNPLTMRMLSSTPPTPVACTPTSANPAAPHQPSRIWEREPAPLLSAQYETLSDSDD